MSFSKRIPHFLFFISYFLFLLSMASCKFRQKVSLIIHHATIYAVDKDFTVQQAMAVQNGKIVAVGKNEDILKNYEADSMQDASGKFIYPGFIDAHCHFTGYATDLWKCDLTGTTSFEDVLHHLADFTKSYNGLWIYGRGWDQNDWPVKEFPSKEKLDSLFKDKPVFLKRVDGHAALVNQKALDIAGISANTKINGGQIELRNGQPTGILVDNAMDVVENKIPLIADALAMKFYLQAQEECFSYGLTGVHDCGVSEHTIELVDAAQKEGKLKMKIFALLSDSSQYYERWIKKGAYKTDRLHVGGFKLYADGALGSRGACLLQPYLDKPGWSGFLLSTPDHFKQVAQQLVNTDLQMCTHAIGDSGNRIILDIYGAVLKGRNDKRWRIEHAQVVQENDFSLFGKYNIVPSIQPTHATSDMYWAGERLGSERIKGAYAYKQLLAENGWIPLGTDFPVEYISPFKTFYAAIARMDNKGFPPGGFQMENALSRKEALMGMTIWAAKAAFEENEKGSLEPGKAADFIIIDTDIMNCPPENILTARVLETFVDAGRVFHK